MVRMAKGRRRGDDYTGGWKRSALRAPPELRVSHIFADVRRTKSFSLVPLFSTRKSCSVAVLTRNTRLKRFPTPAANGRPVDLCPLWGVGQRIPTFLPFSSLFSFRPSRLILFICWPARGGPLYLMIFIEMYVQTWEGRYVRRCRTVVRHHFLDLCGKNWKTKDEWLPERAYCTKDSWRFRVWFF